MTAPTINGPKTARPAIPGQRTDSDPLETTTGDRSEEITPEISAEDLDAQSPAADLVRVYLNGIGKTALLTAAQEVELAKRIEAGGFGPPVLDESAPGDLDKQYAADLRAIVRDGRRARNHLLEANLRLVVSLAKRYTGRGMPLLDLIQEAITRGMADQARTIRLPVHLVEQVNKLARIKRDLHQKLGRDATHEELATESGIAEEKIADLLDHARDPVSLDMPVGSEEEAPLGDFIEDGEATDAETTVISHLLHDDLRRVLSTLEDREQSVIRMRYGLDDGQPRTLDQIGRRFGLSPRVVGGPPPGGGTGRAPPGGPGRPPGGTPRLTASI